MKTNATPAEIETLHVVKTTVGRNWKSVLRKMWITGDYTSEGFVGSIVADLQTLCNHRGLTWLVNFKFPKDQPSEEFKAATPQTTTIALPNNRTMPGFSKVAPPASTDGKQVTHIDKDGTTFVGATLIGKVLPPVPVLVGVNPEIELTRKDKFKIARVLGDALDVNTDNRHSRIDAHIDTYGNKIGPTRAIGWVDRFLGSLLYCSETPAELLASVEVSIDELQRAKQALVRLQKPHATTIPVIRERNWIEPTSDVVPSVQQLVADTVKHQADGIRSLRKQGQLCAFQWLLGATETRAINDPALFTILVDALAHGKHQQAHYDNVMRGTEIAPPAPSTTNGELVQQEIINGKLVSFYENAQHNTVYWLCDAYPWHSIGKFSTLASAIDDAKNHAALNMIHLGTVPAPMVHVLPTKQEATEFAETNLAPRKLKAGDVVKVYQKFLTDGIWEGDATLVRRIGLAKVYTDHGYERWQVRFAGEGEPVVTCTIHPRNKMV